MKDQQLFKALCAGLPYGLKYKTRFDETIFTLIGLTEKNSISINDYRAYNKHRFSHFLLKDLPPIPIYHALSDITKPITHKGEEFVPLEYFERTNCPDEHNQFIACLYNKLSDGKKIENHYMSYRVFEKLISWHFDLWGLIEQGKAIDVNTLKENPYK